MPARSETSIVAIYAVMANGFVSNTGNAHDRRAVLARRHGLDAHDDLARPRRPELRRDHGGRRLPRAADPSGPRRREVDRPAARLGHRHVHRPEHHRRRPVRRHRHAQPHLPAEFARRGIAPRMLSRAVEDSGTVTSPLVPWNSCGAYMAGVLGVATVAYLPFAFFNLLSPLISLIYGFTGFRIEHVRHRRARDARRRSPPTPCPGRRAPHDRRAAASPAETGRAGSPCPRPTRSCSSSSSSPRWRPGSSRPARTTSTPTASRSPAPTTRSRRTRSGSSSTR